ncbi:MAG: hypothetical protein U5O39_15795 [Gammaproteobacteria bacterium]|nr:hypothetical protein [Gammaproteobacteria bacterium]
MMTFAPSLSGERRRLVSYVRSRLAESAEVDPEDIVQDVLVRFIERRDALLPLENVVA